MNEEANRETLDEQWAQRWMRLAAYSMALHHDELVALDRAIGDGDHGENMDRGFSAVVEALDAEQFDSAAAVLKKAAMVLMSKVGGAAGPLYGTALLRGSSALADVDDTDDGAAQAVALLSAARDGVVARGKAEVGEATMIDALAPGVEAAAEAAKSGEGAAAVLAAAARAAERGAESTDELRATKGRASYLAERSIGHRDPGAASTALLLAAAAKALDAAEPAEPAEPAEQ